MFEVTINNLFTQLVCEYCTNYPICLSKPSNPKTTNGNELELIDIIFSLLGDNDQKPYDYLFQQWGSVY